MKKHIKKAHHHVKRHVKNTWDTQVELHPFRIIFVGAISILFIATITVLTYTTTQGISKVRNILAKEPPQYAVFVYPYQQSCPDPYSPICFYGAQGIQKALDYARSGETIFIKNGRYEGVGAYIGNQDPAYDKFDLTIQGESQDETILNGLTGTNVFNIYGQSTVTIQNMTIANGGLSGIGAYDFSTVIIKQNTIADNQYNGIIFFDQARSPEITLNTISNNTQAGIAFFDFSYGTMYENEIRGNGLQGVFIGTLNYEIKSTIENNTVENNKQSGIALFNFGNADIRGNTIQGNQIDGITVQNEAQTGFVDTNTVRNNAYYGILVLDYGQATIQPTNTFDNNGIADAYCYGTSSTQCIGFDSVENPSTDDDASGEEEEVADNDAHDGESTPSNHQTDPDDSSPSPSPTTSPLPSQSTDDSMNNEGDDREVDPTTTPINPSPTATEDTE